MRLRCRIGGTLYTSARQSTRARRTAPGARDPDHGKSQTSLLHTHETSPRPPTPTPTWKSTTPRWTSHAAIGRPPKRRRLEPRINSPSCCNGWRTTPSSGAPTKPHYKRQSTGKPNSSVYSRRRLNSGIRCAKHEARPSAKQKRRVGGPKPLRRHTTRLYSSRCWRRRRSRTCLCPTSRQRQSTTPWRRLLLRRRLPL